LERPEAEKYWGHCAALGRMFPARLAPRRQLHSPIDDNYISPVVVDSLVGFVRSFVVVVPFVLLLVLVVVVGASVAVGSVRPSRALLARSAASSARTLFPTISTMVA